MPHTALDLPRPLAIAAAEWGQREPDLTYFLLWRAIIDGRFPAVRVGSRWFVRDTDISAWLGRRAAERSGHQRVTR
jgi:hypothetical protein